MPSNIGNNEGKNKEKDFLDKRIEAYKDRLKSLEDVLPKYKAMIRKWLNEHQIETQNDLDDVTIYLYDPVIMQSSQTEHRSKNGAYNPQDNSITINIQADDSVIMHEYCHALSNFKNNTLGWRKASEDGNSLDYEESNNWLDEYCAMDLSNQIYGEDILEQADEEDGSEVYRLYFDMGRVFTEQIGADDLLLTKAYLGSPVARKEIIDLCYKRYGCTFADLEEALLGFSDELYAKSLGLLKGNPVELEVNIKPGSYSERRFGKLEQIFPNLHVINTRDIK